MVRFLFYSSGEYLVTFLLPLLQRHVAYELVNYIF